MYYSLKVRYSGSLQNLNAGPIIVTAYKVLTLAMLNWYLGLYRV